jgi:CHRD domain/Bacterial Ig domain
MGNRYLAVIAAFAVLAGCHGEKDTTAPSASVAALPATVSRTVTLTASASDDAGVTSVEFLVDGSTIGVRSTAPYTIDWNTGSVADGNHTITVIARDALDNKGTSAPVTVAVRNIVNFAVTPTGAQEVPATTSAGTGTGTITVNLATGAVTGSVTATGFTSNNAHIHNGFAGTTGPVLIGFTADTTTAGKWNAPAGAALSTSDVNLLLAGALYFNVHSAANPGGEVRAQLLPAGTVVYRSDLAGIQEIPAVFTSARGSSAITLNTATRLAQIFVNTTGADDATDAHLHRGAAGSSGAVAVALARDAAVPTRWFVRDAQLSQADFDALQAAGTYLNVHTPANPSGEIRGQVVPTGYAVYFGVVNGEQEVPAPQITVARGVAAITLNTATGAVDGRINGTGIDNATAAHFHQGFGGINGPVIVGLERDATNLGLWKSNAATLTAAQVTALQEGGFYANVHSAAAPAGLIRGQMLPPNVQMIITHMTGSQAVPAVTTTATARATTTVNLSTAMLTTHVNTTGLQTASAALVRTGGRTAATGTTVATLTLDTAAQRWSASNVQLTAQQLNGWRNGTLHLNVSTPTNPTGEVRGQLELAGVTPLQFTDIQLRVFNASCALSGCHAGATPARGLSLEAANSFTSLVNVDAAGGQPVQPPPPAPPVPLLKRIAPGEAPNSYLVRKLEGTPGIAGNRMPLGRAPLPQNVIDGIKAWVNAGAIAAAAAPAGDVTPPAVTFAALPATLTGTVTLTATATDAVGVTLVRWRVNGSVVGSDSTDPYTFDWNSASVANGTATIDAQALDAAGNIGTSALRSTTVTNTGGVAAFTFTEIQTQVLNVSCATAGCHSGLTPPAGLDLSTAVSSPYTRLVNATSVEVPSLRRIVPLDPNNSYLIQKIEGTAAVGQRMPLGGPFLDATTISRIRAWVSAGAPNN